MELILVRHPRPVVAEGICYGRSDLPADPDALATVCEALRADGLPGDVPVISSPLRRCAGLAQRLSPLVTFDANLAEMDFGSWELRSWNDIARAEVDAWAADLLHYRPGGGESVLDVAHRVAGALARIRQHGSDRAIVICHAGTMRLIATLADGTPLEQAALAAASRTHRIPYGGVQRQLLA
ncbi:histidine phosphatase family protein [Pseudoduganella umbonata]|uniref:Alpha-ribazole phosphatase n=1 Tax=Pseudoduganella umbonata TaxID=864828 RepID=A0A4P8HX49_9BURK|nr:histidine phosphatase family protein [Pseudoduganella umbonata]MBB3225378.1 alpha-ribazole phosphatase [Pseudoduganella umbonata]QCP13230.1 phosphoglycerate mutase [Pseudoduganella umbonata]